MQARRVVTGVQGGKSVILADGPPANYHEYLGSPDNSSSVLWATAAVPKLPLTMESEPKPGLLITPPPGETRMMIVRFPPDAVLADPRFDGAKYYQEARDNLPGLIDCFETADPAMHRTDSIDYDVVLDGEVWLEVDDGVATRLTQGDVVIQGGARHAWRNKSDRPATMLFVLIGARNSAG